MPGVVEEIDVRYPKIEKGQAQDGEESDDGAPDLSFEYVLGKEVIIEAIDKEQMTGQEADAIDQDIRWGTAKAKDIVEEDEGEQPEEDVQEDPLPGEPFQECYVHQFRHALRYQEQVIQKSWKAGGMLRIVDERTVLVDGRRWKRFAG